jgi:ABC-2 type transport system permease protein
MKKIVARKPSSFKAFRTLAWYSFLAGIRNPSAVFFGFLLPIIFIAVFGLLGQGGRTFELAIREASIQAGPAYEVLNQIEVLELVTDKTEAEITEGLNKGQLPAALTISQREDKGFQLKLETSAADIENANVVKSILDGVINNLNNPPSSDAFKLVELEETVVEGRKFTQIDFILPGQLAFALLSTGVFSIVFTFISLRETLVIKRIFATPAPRWTIILSEVAAKLVNALMQSSVIIIVGVLLFNFTLANGIWTFMSMLVLSALGLIVFLGFGFLVASVAKDENSAPPLANLITLPQFLLSGTFFPIDVFPDFLQPIARLLPMTHLNDAFRAVSFEGATLLDVLPQIGALLIWGVIVYVISTRIFKWE